MNAALTTRLSRMRANIQAIDQQLEYETATIARHTNRIKQLEGEKAELIKAVGVIDRCIQIVSANGVGKIEGIVTDGLQRIFGDNIRLVIEKKEGSRGSSYRILVKDGDTMGDPMDSFGGGIQNVIAFLLRVILIKRFRLAPLLVLDEQFSNVSPEYQPRIAQVLKTLAGLGFTIFAVSHQSLITEGADNIYEVVPLADGCGAGPKLQKVFNPWELSNERPPAVANQSQTA